MLAEKSPGAKDFSHILRCCERDERNQRLHSAISPTGANRSPSENVPRYGGTKGLVPFMLN